MKKDMSTFEMAQAAYENPGKVFVETTSTFDTRVQWADFSIFDLKTGRAVVLEVAKHAVKLQHLSGSVEWKSFSDQELERYWELVEVLPPAPGDESNVQS